MARAIRNTDVAPLRADAARNVHRILDAAARLLGEDPSAGMGRIATEAHVGRATLYRHFPTREALIEALRARGQDEVRDAIAASRIDEGTAREALERVFVELLDVSDRYRFFASEEQPGRPHSPHERTRRAIAAPLVGLVERGQRDGELASEIPADWVLTVLSATVLLSLRRIARGESTREEAIRLGLATLLDGVGR